MSLPPLNVGNVTVATIPNLSNATTYVCWVTAYNSLGHESQPSNQVSHTTLSSNPVKYTLTVIRGSGSGPYPTGTYVPVSADAPDRGEEFAYWEDDTAILQAPRTNPENEAFIPLQDVTITAVYSALPKYTVMVTMGNGDGNYFADETVSIVADDAPAGQQFEAWTGNVTFADASSPTTTFTMPASDVIVTATYSAIDGSKGTGLRGQYYNDSSDTEYPLADPFAGSPVLTRTDATVNFNWGDDSPAPAVTPDFFSVKWTGQVKAPVSGNYTFSVTGDDGVRLFINGTLVIDGWRDQGATSYTYPVTLNAGTLYDIELHYYENGGVAVCRLRWSYPGQSSQAIPQSRLYPSN